MTLSELQTIYKRPYKTLQQERFMRLKVFHPTHPKHEEKLTQIDQALADVETIKDELKRHLTQGQPQQAALIDVPARYA